ncbi:MAG: hypothetical protein ACI9C4_000076 [Paraglaciecola sp.]|jgi:hypothetical protein
MDDLEFRRTIYADPNSDDQQLLETAQKDNAKQEFWSDIKKIDASLKNALEVSVPDDLAHKLILRQTIDTHHKQTRRNRLYLSLAASITLVVGLSFTLWQKQPSDINLSAQSLAHVYHEGPNALQANENFTLQQINTKLAQYGGHLSSNIGQVYYANHCEFDHVKSLHIVMQGENSRVTVFVVPHIKGHKAQDNFSDGFLTAQAIELQNASLVVVGENTRDVALIRSKLKQRMLFNA